jgi:hypothetical protein
MDNPSVLDVRVGLFRWMIGGVAGVSLAAVILLVIYVYIVEIEAVQFALIAVLMVGLTAFAYKTEVERQEAEIARDQTTTPPSADSAEQHPISNH